MASGTIDGTRAGRRRQLRHRSREPSCTPVAAPRLHRPEPRCSPTSTPTGRCVSPLADDEELPGAQGLRRVLRLRAREHGERRRARRDAGDDPARGRDHLARLVRAGRPGQADRRRPRPGLRARRTPTLQVYVAPGSEPNNGLTTDPPPATSSRSPRAGATARRTRAAFDGVARRRVDIAQLKARFPADAGDFNGREPPPGAAELQRPARTSSRTASPCKVVVTSVQAGTT